MFDGSQAYFLEGVDHARSGKPYSPPSGRFTDGLSRASYRTGYIVQRVRGGKQALPALIGTVTVGPRLVRYYWLVDWGPPVFNVTRTGTAPEGTAGYHDLGALLKLKGDRWAEFRAL